MDTIKPTMPDAERTAGSLHRACSACSFYNSETSECRRKEPTVAGTTGGFFLFSVGFMFGGTNVAWPEVEEDDWCGEFQSTPNEKLCQDARRSA